jgi:glycosyltransferase involved in cell wall biosynthesis
MKRILMCSQQFSVGGISRVVQELRGALTRLGYSVEIMAPSYLVGEEVDIPIPSLNMPGLPGSLLFWKLATRIARGRKDHYDLIMMHHPVLLDKSLNSINNVIVVFHGTYYGYSQSYRLHKLGWCRPYYDLATRIEKRLLESMSDNESAEKVVTGVSPSTISELHANGYRGVAYFVPNAIQHIPEIVNKKRARNLLNRCTCLRIGQDDRVLLYVSRIDPQKQSLLVPSIFIETAKHNPKMNLVIVGKGSLSHQLERLTKRYNNIFCLGFVSQDIKHLLYSCADAYISLSCYEGLPNSVLEAAAYGLPLILSDIPPHRWIISERLGHGILVNSFNPLIDISIVQTLLESLSGLRCYPDSNIRKKLSWNQIAESYLRIAKIY